MMAATSIGIAFAGTLLVRENEEAQRKNEAANGKS